MPSHSPDPVNLAGIPSAGSAPTLPGSWRSLIRGALSTPSHATSRLADANHTLYHSDIPDNLDAIQAELMRQGVRSRDAVVLSLTNSVTSALTLLTLLETGHRCVLAQASGQSSPAAVDDSPRPRFCRWVIEAEAWTAARPSDPAVPVSFLRVQPNPQWSGSDDPALFSSNTTEVDPSPHWQDSAQLYLRTSGSLGSPKLAVHPEARLCGNVLGVLERLGLGPQHRIALPAPIFHLYGLGAAFLPALLGGASLDLQPRANLLRYLEREEAFDPNVAFMTPSFCETLLRGRRSDRAYDFIVTAGDRLAEATFSRSEARHGPLINLYGSTEMGVIACGELTLPAALRGETVGRPLPGVECRLAAPAEGDPNVGELELRHPWGFAGYVDLDGQPLRPATAFTGDWYRTGDLARIGPAGTLQILGRCDLSLNRQGRLLPFADVECELRALAGVAEAAVAAGAEGIRGRALIAFCILEPGVQLTETDLLARYAQRVPAFARPDVLHIVDELPRLPNGKLDRQALLNRVLG